MSRCYRPLRGLVVLAMALSALMLSVFAAGTPQEFYAELENNLRAQKASFSIVYTGDAVADGLLVQGAPYLGLLARQMSARSPDGADNADYPALNIESGEVTLEENVFVFKLAYLATQAELDEVSRRAKEIVDGFVLTGENDFTKVKLLYAYISSHYVYDETLTKFSAYDGLTTGSMVCQGYALLTYRVMWDAGIPCRIITGVSGGENHAWNIVKVDGSWYNLDTTWDAVDKIGGRMGWDYFLKSMTDFTGHTRFDPFATTDYMSAHPMAQKSRELPQIKLSLDGGAVFNVILRSGIEVQLVASTPDGVANTVEWSSADPSLVSVTADGRVMANALGTTLITVQISGNRGVIAAQLPVTTVDLRTASDWSFESVTAFYLHQLLPLSLIGDFQKGITRGELARLLSHFVEKTKTFPSFSIQNIYEDIGETEDGLAILNCKAIGLLDGTSAQFFRPDDVLTREQAAKALVRLMEYLDDAQYAGDSALSAFADADEVGDWAAPFVATAAAHGVLQGNDGAYRPQQEMTREQIIVALERVYQRWQARQPEQKAA